MRKVVGTLVYKIRMFFCPILDTCFSNLHGVAKEFVLQGQMVPASHILVCCIAPYISIISELHRIYCSYREEPDPQSIPIGDLNLQNLGGEQIRRSVAH